MAAIEETRQPSISAEIRPRLSPSSHTRVTTKHSGHKEQTAATNEDSSYRRHPYNKQRHPTASSGTPTTSSNTSVKWKITTQQVYNQYMAPQSNGRTRKLVKKTHQPSYKGTVASIVKPHRNRSHNSTDHNCIIHGLRLQAQAHSTLSQ